MQVSEGNFRMVRVVTFIPEVVFFSLGKALLFRLVEELKLHSCLLQLCTIKTVNIYLGVF